MTRLLVTAAGGWLVFYGWVLVVARRRLRRRGLPRTVPHPALPDPWQHPGWCYEVVKAGAWVHQQETNR